MFKDRLKLVRQAAGMTMGQLSAAMTPSVSPKTISKCEKGKFMPSSTVLLGMCKVLGTHLDFLLGGHRLNHSTVYNGESTPLLQHVM